MIMREVDVVTTDVRETVYSKWVREFGEYEVCEDEKGVIRYDC